MASSQLPSSGDVSVVTALLPPDLHGQQSVLKMLLLPYGSHMLNPPDLLQAQHSS